MTDATELERKFQVPDGFTLPDLREVPGIDRVGEPRTQQLDAIYFDTPNQDLLRHEMVLRRRTGGDDEGWHLKVGGMAAQRTEHRRPLDDAAAPPRELITTIPLDLDLDDLRPVARVRTLRTERPLFDRNGRTLASIAQDDVEAERLADRARSQWHEIEAELVGGEPAVLDGIDALMVAAGARPGTVPKVARALTAG
jgi:inorganic triphosphatase YgiF